MTEKAIDIAGEMTALGKASRAASLGLATSSEEQRNSALLAAAAALRSSARVILDANEEDMSAAIAKGSSAAMLDRLKLDDE